jgi:hypothetical protein
MLPRSLLLGLIAVALTGTACGPDFDPFNRLTSLRVLAIRSEPPLPGPGETASLSALVYSPADDPPVSYEWSWCPLTGPADQGYPCLVTGEQIAQLEQAGVSLPPFDLGTGPTATLPHAINPLVLAELCAGAAGLPQLPACEGGFPVQVRFTVRSAASAVTAVRQLRLRFQPDAEPNQNPSIEGLMARQDGAFVPMAPQAPLTLPRDEETLIRAVVTESASEEYAGKDNDQQPARVREQLVLTWFVESGDTRSEHTSFIFGQVPLDSFRENRWTPARTKKYPAPQSRVIVVLRDSRGGVSWTEGAANLGEDP